MDDLVRDMWKEYDLGKLSKQLEEMLPVREFRIEEVLNEIITGDIFGALRLIWDGTIGDLENQFAGVRDLFATILLMGIFAALVSHFIEVFDNHQIADMSFYFTYLLMNTVLIRCFHEMSMVGQDAIENILSFVRIFIPTYLVTVGVAVGPSSAYANYSILIVLILLVQNVIAQIAMPLVYGYVFVSMLGGIWWDEKLNLLTSLLEKSVGLLLKLILGLTSGISLIQSMITPVIDSVKNTGLQKAVSAIPGIGNAAEGVVEIVLGSAVVVKNSLGILGMLILVGVCLIPLIRIFIIACVIKISASLLGMICDKRIATLMDRVGSGGLMVLKATGTGMLLFVIAISAAAFAVR